MTVTSPLNSSPASSEAWDETAALNAVDGDRDLMVELAGLFLQDSGTLTAQIGAAVAAGDAHTLHVSAHTLKGSVGNFAAHRAREAAYQLEMMGRIGDLSRAAEGFQVMQREIRQVEAALAEFMRA